MALKMNQNYQKNATDTAKQQTVSTANFYINRAGKLVPFAKASITTKNTQNNNQDKLPQDCEDVESIKGRFSWILIAGYHVPYIMRIINGELLKFVSVHMVETQLLSNYLHYLNVDIYKCTSVKSYFVTDSEAKLLNEINQIHADCTYGKEMFFAGKDYIVHLEDVHEFYTFIEVCCKKLLCKITPGSREKCGFIRINSDSVVPYCIKDEQKLVPLFYFEGDIENLINRAVKLENWDLAYLKFCCKVQGVRYELYANDCCTVINLDDIKNYYPPETNFEEYWPAKVVDNKLLINQKFPRVNPPGAWIRAPSEVAPAENTISHTLTAPAPVLPQIMPVMMNTYQNRWLPNQMGSTMTQGSSLINGVGHVVPPPPLVRTGYTEPVIGNTVSYSNVVEPIRPISQYGTTMNNPMTKSNVMSHSSQMRQFNTQFSNNIQAQQQQLQQQKINTNPQTQQSYSGQSVNGCATNTQQHNALRNVVPVVIAPPIETINLLSPPSSSIHPTVQRNPLLSNIGCVLTKIPERMSLNDKSDNYAYKLQKTTLQERMIYCINAKPYIYSDLMVTLDDLVQMVLRTCTVATCAFILHKYLKITLFSGNSGQLAVLWKNGRVRSMHPDDTPMAMLQDVSLIFPQLRFLVLNYKDKIPQYQSMGGLSKRQRTN